MAVVDTSVLLPLFDMGHANHAKAKAALSDIERIATHGGVLAELTRLIRRRAILRGMDGNIAAREAVRALRALPGFRDTGDGLGAKVERRYAAETGLSYADAWGIEAALADRDDLLTFDAKQAAAWRKANR